jgi:hypothetical protein
MYQYFNNNISSSSFNPSHTHVLPSHHISSPHHISSHSLIGMDDSLSSMPQRPRLDHILKPRKGRRTPLSSQVKLYLGKVHSRQVGICIDQSTRNSAEVYTTHKITIIDKPARLGWFRAAFQPDTVPPYHLELGPCRSTIDTLRLWDIVLGHEVLHCLRRVWVLVPVPPYTIR